MACRVHLVLDAGEETSKNKIYWDVRPSRAGSPVQDPSFCDDDLRVDDDGQPSPRRPGSSASMRRSRQCVRSPGLANAGPVSRAFSTGRCEAAAPHRAPLAESTVCLHMIAVAERSDRLRADTRTST
jgi:hypothetical protein